LGSANSGRQENLQSAQDVAEVRRRNSVSRGGIVDLEESMCLRGTVPGPLRQARSEARIRRFARRKTLQEGFEVEARAPADDGQAPAARDLRDHRPGLPSPAPRRIMLAPIGDVDQ